MFAKAVHQACPCFACLDLLTKRAGYAVDDVTEMHVKWSVALADRLGPKILTVFEIKDKF